jgi:hypothetical protein
MPIDITNPDHHAAIDEAGHCVNARKNGLHIQFITIDVGPFFRVGRMVIGPVTLVSGANNLLANTEQQVAGTAALLAFGINPGHQQDVREAITNVAQTFADADKIVKQTQDKIELKMRQPVWHDAIERVADHLLVVRTIEEIDADTVIDGLL